jgi:hypothetical protein
MSSQEPEKTYRDLQEQTRQIVDAKVFLELYRDRALRHQEGKFQSSDYFSEVLASALMSVELRQKYAREIFAAAPPEWLENGVTVIRAAQHVWSVHDRSFEIGDLISCLDNLPPPEQRGLERGGDKGRKP